ncbi:uncharacterized protein B0H64DRAFT_381597 [Chaetomium fimeti]|uniref:Uncharacterized protein n=1 Tax=Chaetomium fimeti TaxID=1854472 RepID=A0AAE0LXV9_9PEZI|nr:hypothetical protein B0H64DRAFT_381597 [Chaetomium fimeti]
MSRLLYIPTLVYSHSSSVAFLLSVPSGTCTFRFFVSLIFCFPSLMYPSACICALLVHIPLLLCMSFRLCIFLLFALVLVRHLVCIPHFPSWIRRLS